MTDTYDGPWKATPELLAVEQPRICDHPTHPCERPEQCRHLGDCPFRTTKPPWATPTIEEVAPGFAEALAEKADVVIGWPSADEQIVNFLIPLVTPEEFYKGDPAFRTFESGATRDLDEHKLDFEGFLSPRVLQRFAEYMHGKRMMADGSLRDSDNWQKGIPLDAYMKSMFRHFMAVWSVHRLAAPCPPNTDDLCGLLFNVMGYLHEVLKTAEELNEEVRDL